MLAASVTAWVVLEGIAVASLIGMGFAWWRSARGDGSPARISQYRRATVLLVAWLVIIGGRLILASR